MDIRTLRYFQSVAECGSYSRGSEFLRISQPAVSRTIRNLEEELGRPVFKRNGHGVTLTEAGRILLERSQSVLRQLEQTKRDIRSGGDGLSGVISFALPPAAGYFLAPKLLERFGRKHPNVFLKLVGGFSGYIHEWLVRGHVDAACVHDPVPQRGFNVIPLMQEEVFVVGRAGSFPFRDREVSASRLVSLPLILPSRPNASRRLLDNWMVHRAIWVDAKVEVDDHMITRSLVKQGIGFSLLTRCAIADELRRGEVEARPLEPRVFWPLALMSCQDPARPALLQPLIETVREVTQELIATGTWPGQAPDGTGAAGRARGAKRRSGRAESAKAARRPSR